MAKILLVDDDPVKRELVQTILQPYQHEILEAEDGEQALLFTYSFRPHLVILDLIMPGLDGYDYLKAMRADPTIAHTTVVTFSALDPYSHQVTLAQHQGVEYVIPVPSEPETVLKAINDALAGLPGPITKGVTHLLDCLEPVVHNLKAAVKKLPSKNTTRGEEAEG